MFKFPLYVLKKNKITVIIKDLHQDLGCLSKDLEQLTKLQPLRHLWQTGRLPGLKYYRKSIIIHSKMFFKNSKKI